MSACHKFLILNADTVERLLALVYEVIDKESPTTGVWVLDWVIYIQIINEISSIAREVDQGASSRL